MNLSVIILTKNEENNIFDCIESVNFADEILVIDDYSTDRTLEVIKNLLNRKVKIFRRRLNSDFSAQRNFGLTKAKGEWILFVDADERVSKDLENEVRHLIETHGRGKKLNGFFIKRFDFMWGRLLRHGEIGNIKLLRLARKKSGTWSGAVHEEWKMKGDINELKNPLIHHPHQSIREFLKEVNFYTDLRAQELFNQGAKTNVFLILLYPKAKFVINYFLKLGFLDGIQGLVFALMMSFHSFLIRGKLWLLWQKK